MSDLCILCAERDGSCEGHPDSWIAVEQMLLESASDETLDRVRELVGSREADWIWDPVVENVAGLVWTGTDRAVMVVYLDHQDFECAAEFFEGVVVDE
jgi:hypothetical protein